MFIARFFVIAQEPTRSSTGEWMDKMRCALHGITFSSEKEGIMDTWTSFSLFTCMHWRRRWQPIPVFLPGESQGRRSLVGCCLWGRTESDTTEVTEAAAAAAAAAKVDGASRWC